MNYRKLGATDLKVSEIGFGAWGIGGAVRGAVAYGPTVDSKSRAALRKAFELGINFFDTADFYGFGHSEQLIGSEFKKLRGNIIIASKVGYVGFGKQDFSPVHIKSAVDKSLRRLKTDYIDLYQLHDPSLELLSRDPEILETMNRLKKAGKIRYAGISVRSPEDGLEAAKKFKVSSIQVNFNLTDQRILTNGLLSVCKKKGIGIVGRTPLCFGFLTNRENKKAKYGPQDHRALWSGEQREKWAGAYAKFSKTLKTPGQTPAQMALRFCLSYPEISTVIPGMLLPSQVEENAAAGSFASFKKSKLDQVRKIYERNVFFLGSAARVK